MKWEGYYFSHILIIFEMFAKIYNLNILEPNGPLSKIYSNFL